MNDGSLDEVLVFYGSGFLSYYNWVFCVLLLVKFGDNL